MLKFIFTVVLIVAIGVGGLMAAGYRFHSENIPHYMKFESTNTEHEVTFTNGSVMTGVIEAETESAIRFNIDGAVTEFSKSGIKSIRTQTGDNALINFINNAQKQNKIHPLMTKDTEKSLTGAFDRFAMEPSRIADEIKKKNPGISQTAELEKQARANAKARQDAYKAAIAQEAGQY